jgi:hypothetical protein
LTVDGQDARLFTRGVLRLDVRRLAPVLPLLAIAAALAIPGSALAAPGDPTLNGCVGDLAACTAVNPTGVVGGLGPLAAQGNNLYSIGYYTALSHYTLDASGTKP